MTIAMHSTMCGITRMQELVLHLIVCISRSGWLGLGLEDCLTIMLYNCGIKRLAQGFQELGDVHPIESMRSFLYTGPK